MDNIKKILNSRKDELLKIIDETERKQSEIGSRVCLFGSDVLPFDWGAGTEKRLKLKDLKQCIKNSEEIGKIHTHPSQWLPDLSLNDKIISISDGDNFSLILHKDVGEQGWYNATIYEIDKQNIKYNELKKAADIIRGSGGNANISDYNTVDNLFNYVVTKNLLFAAPPTKKTITSKGH